MKDTDLKQRTKEFALRVIRMADALPRKTAADVLGRQLIRSVTSVAANYRSACRARSHADFIAKMGVVEEEADESVLWLEMLGESELMVPQRLEPLHREAQELTAIAVSSVRTARARAIRRRAERAIPQSAISNPQ